MADRFDSFSDETRATLRLAQEEAQRFNHNYIGTEHLLLGLLRQPDSIAMRALAAMGVSLAKARSAVEFIIGRGPRAVSGEIGLTPRAKKVLELAVRSAGEEQAAAIGAEHLLLGLAREGQGIAAGVLKSLGADPARVREALDRVRSGDTTPLPPQAPPASAAAFLDGEATVGVSSAPDPSQPLRTALTLISHEAQMAEQGSQPERAVRLRTVIRDLQAIIDAENDERSR